MKMRRAVRLGGGLALGAAGLAGLGWAGLQIRPQPFPPYPEETPVLQSVPLPQNLPAPVARFYRIVAGDRLPQLTSAVITMRGTLRFAGVTFPARLRFTHDAGQGYRHYIEATLFGLPLMKVNERYVDGRARMELPVGVIENEPKINMAANLGLWGESVWLSPIYVTDSGVRWEGVDETTARLVVPFEEGDDAFTVAFDPETGFIDWMEAMRYREADDEEKTRWHLAAETWKAYHGVLVPGRASVTWADEGVPWLVLDVEDVVYNVDVSAYIRSRGR